MGMNTETSAEQTAFNEAKLEILNTINTLGETTSMEIALITNRTPECASMNLLTYFRQGLLSRRKLRGKTRGYSLTPRGRERLIWLESE